MQQTLALTVPYHLLLVFFSIGLGLSLWGFGGVLSIRFTVASNLEPGSLSWSSLDLSVMTHSFVAFVDESGSEGDPNLPGGFEFLVLTATVIRANTDWNYIDLENITARPHHTCEGLRVADFTASSFGAACEPKLYGLTDDRFAVQLAPRLYASRNNQVFRNGLKIFPQEAETDLLKEDRFRWLKTHCPGCPV